MPSIIKRKSSQFWSAVYRDRHGNQIRRSTKLTEKSAALKVALEWERVEQMAKSGTASSFQFQQVVNKVTKELMGESLPSPAIDQYLGEWLEGVKRRLTPESHERYKNTVRLFLKSLGAGANQPLRGISPAHVELFLNIRIDGGAAPRTVIIDIKTLNIAFLRAEKFGLIDRNPVPVVALPKIVGVERDVFTMEEVEKLVAAAPDLDWQTLILLGFYLGGRLGDCVHLTWENVDAEKGLIVYFQKKTGRAVVVPIHTRLLGHLHHVSASFAEGPLCPKLASKTPGGKHGLSEGFKRIVLRAGLDLMIVKGKGSRNMARRTFHSLRHSFSSALANFGVSQEVRMKLTGHKSSDIHQKYTHLSVDPLREAIATLRMPNAAGG